MELEITITDTKHRFIHYENEPLMARITSENRPLHISTKLINIFEQLPCGNPKNNWENKKLSTIAIKIQQSLTKIYHHPQYYEFYDDTNYYDEYFYDIYLGEYGAGTLTIIFCFLSRMLTLCACYPNAICHIKENNLGD